MAKFMDHFMAGLRSLWHIIKNKHLLPKDGKYQKRLTRRKKRMDADDYNPNYERPTANFFGATSSKFIACFGSLILFSFFGGFGIFFAVKLAQHLQNEHNVMTWVDGVMTIFDPSPLVAILAFSLYTPLALATLLLNLFAIVVLAHGHRYFSQRFFFIVGRHLLAADLLSTAAQLSIAVPVSAMSTESAKTYLESTFAQFMLALEALAHLDTFHFVTLQACSFLGCFQQEQMAFRLNAFGSIIGLVVWMLIAGQLLLFGFVPCAKRFDPVTLHFFDSCYWPNPNARGSGFALLNIWLTVLLCCAFSIYAIALSHVRRRIQ
ncbi:hypothetical protein niasHS_008352 [Heterodera schachtii]|uniref:Uncharacterized protein n=1 Tax=Heterodera schachtii TaxID=97005 RepID=A0ABD2JCT5_HETSC